MVEGTGEAKAYIFFPPYSCFSPLRFICRKGERQGERAGAERVRDAAMGHAKPSIVAKQF